jgi:putative heme-binding domain-containing protein
MACLLVAGTAANVASANPVPDGPNPDQAPIPQWLWGEGEAKAREVRNFRVVFDPKIVKHTTEDPSSAMIWLTGDDDATVHLNGKQIARSRETHQAVVADVRTELVPGPNVLTVRVQNGGGGPAGFALKLVVRGNYREQPYTLVSDGSWKVLPEDAPRGWRQKTFDDKAFPAARVLGPYGMEPWGKVSLVSATNQATPVDHITTLPGYKAELLYSVPKGTEGSWVSMTPDPKGRLYVSDQGGPLFRVTVGKDASATKVEPVPVELGAAQGLLWAYDSLYVVINGRHGDATSGLYRVRDTNNDDTLDNVEKLMDFKDRNGTGPAGSEHGPHGIVLGPDKKLYVVAGNFTNLPQPLPAMYPAQHWAEDLLLPRDPDGRGHDPHIFAPAGWVARMDPDGKNVEPIVVGMRNTYDIAFHPHGELFGYDSDMEWDVGTPWYRPTRVLHVVSGGEYGWRNGSGKWPTYYPDSLPGTLDTGAGSPTGVVFGTNAKFPAKYQHAYFAADWAYGKLFAVHLTPNGASYDATYEPFVTGKSFDITDVVINHDGAMYITIGGRGTQSGLYRVTYEGKESTKPVAMPNDKKSAEARLLRRRLEFFHARHDPAAIDFAWKHLNSKDRFIRFAARVAVESQPLAEWQDRALKETKPTAAINALVALCRTGDKSLQPQVLAALDRLNLSSLDKGQKLELLRTYGLCFIRMGKPDAATLASLAGRLDPLFPSGDVDLDHELGQVLTYCGAPSVVGKSMKLMAAAKTQEEQMFWVFLVRRTTEGWTPADREAYFAWLNMAEEKYTGGASFKIFLQNIRKQAAETLSPAEKATYATLLKGPAPKPAVAAAQPVKRDVVRKWEMEELTGKLAMVDSGRNFEKGKAAYEAVGCAQCHIFNGRGGPLGPDLTGVGGRFSSFDLLEAIMKPSKVVSDQYADHRIVTKGNNVLVGAIQTEDAEKIVIRTNPLSPASAETVLKKDIARRGLSKTSSMPEGLLNILKEDEIMDLLAYLKAAGKPDDAAFKK